MTRTYTKAELAAQVVILKRTLGGLIEASRIPQAFAAQVAGGILKLEPLSSEQLARLEVAAANLGRARQAAAETLDVVGGGS